PGTLLPGAEKKAHSFFSRSVVRIDRMPHRWPDFSRRATGAEYIDAPQHLSGEELSQVFHDLALVNRWLGGARAALSPLISFLKNSANRSHARPITVLDVGCGSGDIISSLKRWAEANQVRLCTIGLDLSRAALAIGRLSTESLWIQADIYSLPIREKSVDFVICSAFLHHFDDEAAVMLLRDFARIARNGIVISDLRRHPAAYLGIRILTTLFSSSRAVRHDGPLSVLKAFTPEELKRVVRRAGLSQIHSRK